MKEVQFFKWFLVSLLLDLNSSNWYKSAAKGSIIKCSIIFNLKEAYTFPSSIVIELLEMN